MPRVGNKTYPYTAMGMKAAKSHAKASGQKMKSNQGSGMDAGAKPYRKTVKPRVAPKSYQVAGASSGSSSYTGSKKKPMGVNSSKKAGSGTMSKVAKKATKKTAKKAMKKTVRKSVKSGMSGKKKFKTTYPKRNNSAMSAESEGASGSDVTNFPH